MTDTTRKTWDDMSTHWQDWTPPLRPCPQDIAITRAALSRWHDQRPAPSKPRDSLPGSHVSPHHPSPLRVFLCGVTPEIAAMDWPFPIDLLALDRSPGMVRHVWPGDVPGVRKALVGSWFDHGQPDHSFDIVIGDGGFGFFDYPVGQRRLISILHDLLRPGGIFIYRHFAQADPPESIPAVLADARARRIANYHAFRWRITMALQHDPALGVTQHDSYQAVIAAAIDPAAQPQPGWAQRCYDTIYCSQNKDTRYYFPTADQFHRLLSEFFPHIQIVHAAYELAERCPIFIASLPPLP